MAYDVSALANYTKDNGQILLVKSLFDGKTADLIRSKGNVMSEVKSSARLNSLETDATFQAGGSCGFSASGTTTLNARTITVGSVRVHESLCPKTLEAKAQQQELKAGTANGQIPFEQVYTDFKASKINEQIETAIWQGDTGSGNANLNKWDGLIKIIDASGAGPNGAIGSNVETLTGTVTITTAATSVTGVNTLFQSELAVGDKIYNTAGVLVGTVASIASDTSAALAANGAVAVTAAAVRNYTVAAQAANGGAAAPIAASAGITASNVMSILRAMKNSLPAALKGKNDVVIFCGWDVYDFIVDAHVTANLFSFGKESLNGDGAFVIPGTQYTVQAVHGLNGTNRLFAMRLSNLWLGTDLDKEEAKYEIFWAKEAMETRFVCEFKYGVQVGVPSEIVYYRGA